MEGWVGLVGRPIANALHTKWSHVNHGSGVDQGKSASHRPTFLPLSHAATSKHAKNMCVDGWLFCCCVKVSEMETLRIAEELERQSVQPKHGNVNRYSKDSGVVDIELLKPFDLLTATASVTHHRRSDQSSAFSALVASSDGLRIFYFFAVVKIVRCFYATWLWKAPPKWPTLCFVRDVKSNKLYSLTHWINRTHRARI